MNKDGDRDAVRPAYVHGLAVAAPGTIRLYTVVLCLALFMHHGFVCRVSHMRHGVANAELMSDVTVMCKSKNAVCTTVMCRV